MSGGSDGLLPRMRAFRNSHLMGPQWLFTAVVSEADYTELLSPPTSPHVRPNAVRRALRRAKPWFWPRIADAGAWVESTESEGWNPHSYLRDTPRHLLQHLLATSTPDMSVLDLGCNCGSDLDILRREGYARLFGVDAGRDALRLFRQNFPETWELAEVRHDLFQHYLLTAPTGCVDILHSHGATIELVHPSFPVIRHMSRVASKAIYIQISERGHSYPRDYIGEFARHGFVVKHAERFSPALDGQSLLHLVRS